MGKDFELIREFNPLGRVPTLVPDEGDALLESAAILDYLDELVGPDRALLPPTGRERRDALRVMAIATGAAEKGVLQIYESVFRPEEKRHEPWLERCRAQMHGALAELERLAAESAGCITATCVFSFLSDTLAVGRGAPDYPSLIDFSRRCEAMPEFRPVRVEFFVPGATN